MRKYRYPIQAEYNPLRMPLRPVPVCAGVSLTNGQNRMPSELVEDVKRKIRAALAPKPEDGEENPGLLAFVGAPLKPRSPLKSSSIALRPEQ